MLDIGAGLALELTMMSQIKLADWPLQIRG